MKKQQLLFCTALLFSCSAIAQIPGYSWTKSFGGLNKEYVNAMVVDNKGNVYTSGSFEGTIDIDPNAAVSNLISKGGNDIFISKLDPKGNLVWSKSIGGMANDVAYSLTLDTASNIYITGSFQSYIDFGSSTSLSSLGSDDIFIAKFDVNGNLSWAKSIGGSYADYGRSIVTDTMGGLYLTGKYQGSADFDPSSNYVGLSSSMGSEDIFLLKFDYNGIFQWVKGIGSSSYDVGTSIVAEPSGDVYTTGLYSGVVNFNPLVGSQILKSEGLIDVYIAKYDKSGKYLWAKSFGGADNDYSRGITIDKNFNVYTVGYFSSVASFDPQGVNQKLSGIGGYDAFVNKLDQNGNYIWQKELGGPSSDYAYAVVVDKDENVYTTGSFQGKGDFDPSTKKLELTSNGASDIYISKLDKSGNGLWAVPLGSMQDDEGTAIALYQDNDLYTTGNYRNTIDFNHEAAIDNFTSSGASDVFVHKMTKSSNSIFDNTLDVQLSLFPNPIESALYIHLQQSPNKNYILSIYDVRGSLVKKQDIKEVETLIDMKQAASGLYFVSIANEEGQTSEWKKIIKN